MSPTATPRPASTPRPTATPRPASTPAATVPPAPLPIPRLHPATRLALRAVTWVQSRRRPDHRGHRRSRAAGDRGQATAEYGLVILAAGGIALGVIAWATGTNSFTNLFSSVVRKLTSSL
jgi:hypothetical protein